MEIETSVKQKTDRSGKLKLYVNQDVKVEPILAFAYDVAFFNTTSIKSFQSIKSILDDFTALTGLPVNQIKSNILF